MRDQVFDFPGDFLVVNHAVGDNCGRLSESYVSVESLGEVEEKVEIGEFDVGREVFVAG